MTSSIRELRAGIRSMLKNRSERLEEVPCSQWEEDHAPIPGCVRTNVFLSRDFLVQVFREHGETRISVNRTSIGADGKWRDGITWDQLMNIKGQVGFPIAWAVEIYPPNSQVVNVANMRHLWIVPKPAFAWSK